MGNLTPAQIQELADVVADPVEWQLRYGNQAKQLHQAAYDWLVTPARIKVACWGRQSGKSLMLGENDIPRWALARPNTKQWVLSESQDQAELIFNYMAGVMLGGPLEVFVKEHKDNPWPYITFFNGSHVEARNLAERGKKVRGNKADRVIFDEAAFIPEEAINAVRPFLVASKHREQIYISTPDGLNHFWRLYQQGLSTDPRYKNFKSFHMATWESPFVDREGLEDDRAQMTEMQWKIEYGAEFVEDQNQPFPVTLIKRYTDESLPCPADPQPGHRYVIGYDPADSVDRSGLVTLDVTFLPWKVVNIQNIAGRGWTAQIELIRREAAKYYNCRVLMDATGGSVGHPMLAFLDKEGIRIEGMDFHSAEAKRQLVEGLSLQLEQGDLRYPANDMLLDELTFYRRNVSRTSASNKVKYEATSGHHDDIVTALALACQHAKRHRYTGHQTAVGGQRAILTHYDQSRIN